MRMFSSRKDLHLCFQGLEKATELELLQTPSRMVANTPPSGGAQSHFLMEKG